MALTPGFAFPTLKAPATLQPTQPDHCKDVCCILAYMLSLHVRVHCNDGKSLTQVKFTERLKWQIFPTSDGRTKKQQLVYAVDLVHLASAFCPFLWHMQRGLACPGSLQQTLPSLLHLGKQLPHVSSALVHSHCKHELLLQNFR